jgi:uncharacterized pyridoxal phosphate-containing UPF0001 family protein
MPQPSDGERYTRFVQLCEESDCSEIWEDAFLLSEEYRTYVNFFSQHKHLDIPPLMTIERFVENRNILKRQVEKATEEWEERQAKQTK